MRYIGDVHGKMGEYLHIIDGCTESVQVGDFGAGFVTLPALGPAHRFIRGNHDSPAVCRQHPNWIQDGTHENGVFFVGGAKSIDRAYRIEGISWWPDEELSYAELTGIVDEYAKWQPEVMVTHDCPEVIANALFGGFKINVDSITRQALDVALNAHAPKTWIFGHWHMNVDRVINGTRFICLGELSFIDL